MNFWRGISIAVMAATLGACGGGGGGGSTATGASTGSLNLVTAISHADILVRSMAVGDLNGDGLDDVVIGGWNRTWNSRLFVLIQNTDGTLSDQSSTWLTSTVYQGSQKVFIEDFDGDGRKDVFLPGFEDQCGTNPCDAASVMLWNTGSSFQRQDWTERTQAHGSCVSDIDQDGDLDIVISGGFGTTVAGGLYRNLGNRNFSLEGNRFPSAGYFSTCSISRDSASGEIAILFGGNGKVSGYNNFISVFDQNLNWLRDQGVAGQLHPDLINSVSMDVNGDGRNDFVLMFNPLQDGYPGNKEVWINSGNHNYVYSYTIDSSANNQYYTHSLLIDGRPAVYFSGSNGHSRVYQLNNNAWTELYTDRFRDMAIQAGGRPYSLDWSVESGIVYRGSSNQLYMLQVINGRVYTQKI